jgi:hypothetical protein
MLTVERAEDFFDAGEGLRNSAIAVPYFQEGVRGEMYQKDISKIPFCDPQPLYMS